MKRSARRSYYSWYQRYGNNRVTNWRMIIAMHLGIPISEVREHLGETSDD